MQVDMYNPSLRVLRSHKRARSIEPEESDRPIKRLTIDSRSTSRRTTPEDWVRQTGGLTIESPITTQLGDTVMQDASQLPPDIGKQNLMQSNYHIHDPHKQCSLFPPHSMPHHPQSGSDGPAINVMPPTPSPNAPRLTDIGNGPVQSQPHFQSDSHSSSILVDVSMSPRKAQRFTMGPRSDCEKCRLGVKGHWMHANY